MAIIDLAEACNDFKKYDNQKAAGICYNNIGNFAYKSQKYDQAEDNFRKSISCGKEHLRRELNKNFQNRVEICKLKKTIAHRFYQLSMAVY